MVTLTLPSSMAAVTPAETGRSSTVFGVMPTGLIVTATSPENEKLSQLLSSAKC